MTVRHQLQATIDRSLHQRAYVSANGPGQSPSTTSAFLQGAIDSKVGYLFASGRAVTTGGPNGDKIVLGNQELAVARGDQKWSCRTIVGSSGTDYRVARCRPAPTGSRSLSPSRWSPTSAPWTSWA